MRRSQNKKIGLVIFPGSKNLRVKIIAVLTNVLAVLLRICVEKPRRYNFDVAMNHLSK